MSNEMLFKTGYTACVCSKVGSALRAFFARSATTAVQARKTSLQVRAVWSFFMQNPHWPATNYPELGSFDFFGLRSMGTS